MYHLRFKGTHYENGVKRGNIFNKCGIKLPLNIDSFQMEHGKKSEVIIQKYFSEVCEEVKAISNTIGVDYLLMQSFLLAMGCCMYNLEDNIPKEVRGCTALALKYQGKVFYARNNDLPKELEKGSKSEIYTLSNVKFNLTTSSFINGEEGMNSYGLVCAMTFVGTSLENIRPGFNSVYMVRYLLEKAKSTKEAKALVKKEMIASNYNILLCDKEGDMCVLECNCDLINIRRPIKLDNGLEVICTVNSFTSESMKKYEMEEIEKYDADKRYNTVIEALKAYDGSNMVLYLERLLEGEFGFICQYDKKINFKTIWSSIFNPLTKEIYRAEGDPRKKDFIRDERLMD